jgi:hypothetical protein
MFPTLGKKSGNTIVILTGDNFGPVTNIYDHGPAIVVTVGGVACIDPNVVFHNTHIQCTIAIIAEGAQTSDFSAVQTVSITVDDTTCTAALWRWLDSKCIARLAFSGV